MNKETIMYKKPSKGTKTIFSFFLFFIWALIFINCLIIEKAFGGVEGDLGTFFTELGYDGNITPMSAYQGQAAGYYSGGGAYIRNRVKNIQLMQLDLPSYKAGCGGIDLFGGGFSFIDARELTEFFQRIMSNAGGYMFNLALETAVPSIAHGMQFIQKMAQEMNSSNFNSCEMAETMVGGMWPRLQATQQHICKDLGNTKNLFTDWAQARQRCGQEGDFKEKMDLASKDNSEYKKRVIINKNLIWDALLNSHYLFGDKRPQDTKVSGEATLAEFFMSLSGTIIYKLDGKTQVYSPLAKDRGVIKALLEGGKARIYICDVDSSNTSRPKEKCLNPTLQEITISKDKALYEKVKKTINDIVEALTSEGKGTNNQGLTKELKDFLEITKFPILKFITAHLMSGNTTMAFSISNYSEAISKSILMEYMHEALQLVENSLSGTDYAPEIHKQLTDQIRQALIYVESIKTESHNDIQELMQFIDSSKKAEQEVTAKATGQIKNSFGVGP